MKLENKIIYLDNAATTKPDKEVVDIFVSSSLDEFYNPSSPHLKGMEVDRKYNNVKNEILNLLKCRNHEVIFTSGATESNNLALKGFAHRYSSRGNHIISSKIEHPSVLNALASLEKEGFSVSYLSCDSEGKFDLKELESLINDKTILISLMAVNNEVGVVQDLNSIKNIVKKYPKIKLHVDAVQGLGKFNINYSDLDMITFSMHKVHGMKSSGLIIKNKSIELVPLFDGGGQENNIRSGTSNYPMAVSALSAVKNAINNLNKNFEYIKEISEPIYNYLNTHLDLFTLNSVEANPYIINFSLNNKKASVVLEALSNYGIMASSKSACSSRLDKGSYVLNAMGKNQTNSYNSIRISLSKNNTKEEIEYFINTLDKVIKEVR